MFFRCQCSGLAQSACALEEAQLVAHEEDGPTPDLENLVRHVVVAADTCRVVD